MNVRALRAIALLAFTAHCMPPAEAAGVSREIHGSADTFADPGIALAWGVLRGTTEASTLIVIRIVTDPALFSDVGVTGGDPFTQDREVLLAAAPSAGTIDVRTPRAHFARFPRTEFQFYAPGSDAAAGKPSLLVFYLGVPDTTPEFADAEKLDGYLRDRIAKLRGSTR